MKRFRKSGIFAIIILAAMVMSIAAACDNNLGEVKARAFTPESSYALNQPIEVDFSEYFENTTKTALEYSATVGQIAEDGLWSYTPTELGSQSITIEAKATIAKVIRQAKIEFSILVDGTLFATEQINDRTLSIDDPELEINVKDLVSNSTGEEETYSLSVTGGSGVTIDSTTGVLKYTPSSNNANLNVTVLVKADGKTLTFKFKIIVTGGLSLAKPFSDIDCKANGEAIVIDAAEYFINQTGKTPEYSVTHNSELDINLVINSDTGILTFTPPSTGDMFTVTLTISANGKSFDAEFTITVEGQLVKIDDLQDQTFIAGGLAEEIDFSSLVSNSTGKEAVYSIVTGGNGIWIHPSTGVLMYTPSNTPTSEFPVVVKVAADGTELLFNFNITVINGLTKSAEIGNQTLDINGNEFTLAIKSFVVNSSGISETYSLNSEALSAGVNINAATGELKYTPASNEVTIPVTVTVTAGTSSINFTFNMNVIPPAPGTAGNPYLITSSSQFYSMLNTYNGAGVHFKQTANIDLSGTNDAAISIQSFNGVYDGGGFTITRNVTDGTSGKFYSIFTEITSGATVRNLNVAVTIAHTATGTQSDLGGLVEINNGIVSKVKVSGTITADGYINVGGIAGTNKGRIEDSENSAVITLRATVDKTGVNVGGIAGALSNSGAVITRSVNKAKITGVSQTGGIVGQQSAGLIEMCLNSADIESTVSNSGGIAGRQSGGAKVRLSVNDGGAVRGGSAGGLVGEIDGSLETSLVWGSPSIGSGENRGGLVGNIWNIVTIKNCYTGIATRRALGKARATMEVKNIISASPDAISDNAAIILTNSFNNKAINSTNHEEILAILNADLSTPVFLWVNNKLMLTWQLDSLFGKDRDIADIESGINEPTITINFKDYIYNYTANEPTFSLNSQAEEAGVSIDTQTGILTYNPTVRANIDVVITAMVEGEASIVFEFNITVTGLIKTGTISDKTLDLANSLNIDVGSLINNTSGESMVYTLNQAATDAGITITDGVLNFVAAQNHVGVINVVISVATSDEEIEFEFSITVKGLAKTDEISDQSLDVNGSFEINLSEKILNTTGVAVSYEITSGQRAGLTLNADGVLTFNPAAIAEKSLVVITITADGHTQTFEFNITVKGLAKTDEIENIIREINGEGISVSVADYVLNTTGVAEEYSLNSAAQDVGVVIDSATGVLSFTPPSNGSIIEVTVTVKVGADYEVNFDFTIIISAFIKNGEVSGLYVEAASNDVYDMSQHIINETQVAEEYSVDLIVGTPEEIVVSIDKNSGLLSFEGKVVGTYDIRVTAEANGIKLTFDITITVTGIKTEGIITPKSIDKDGNLTININDYIVNTTGKEATYEITSGMRTGMTINSITGEFTYIPVAVEAGVEIEVTVTSNDKTATVKFVVTVTGLAKTSEIENKILDVDQNLNLDASTLVVNTTGKAVAYSLNQDALDAGVTINTTTGELDFTAQAINIGVLNVEVYVKVDHYEIIFSFTVTTKGFIKTGDIENQTQEAGNGGAVTVDVSSYIINTTGTAATYEIDANSKAAGVSINSSTGELSFSVPATAAIVNVTVTVKVSGQSDLAFNFDIIIIGSFTKTNDIEDTGCGVGDKIDIDLTEYFKNTTGLAVTYNIETGDQDVTINSVNNTLSFTATEAHRDQVISVKIILSVEGYDDMVFEFNISVADIGTQYNPHKISSATEFYDKINTYNAPNVYFRLVNDIDLSGTNGAEISIANFEGVFDGDGYTITRNVTHSGAGKLYSIFGEIAAGATVKNVNVSLALVHNDASAQTNLGGLAEVNKGTVSNVTVTGTITVGGYAIVGGIVGTNEGTIEQSTNSAVIKADNGGSNGATGGIAGLVKGSDALITRVTNTANIEGAFQVGGIVGEQQGGIIEMSENRAAKVHGTGSNVGGLIGRQLSGSTLRLSVNNGAAVTAGVSGGGLVGEANGTITTSYVWGLATISSSAGEGRGGLVGYIWSDQTAISNSYTSIANRQALGKPQSPPAKATATNIVTAGTLVPSGNTVMVVSDCQENSAITEANKDTVLTTLNAGLSEAVFVWDSGRLRLTWELSV